MNLKKNFLKTIKISFCSVGGKQGGDDERAFLIKIKVI